MGEGMLVVKIDRSGLSKLLSLAPPIIKKTVYVLSKNMNIVICNV